jgi:uncharacterized protein YbjT (DUF2867 family)
MRDGTTPDPLANPPGNAQATILITGPTGYVGSRLRMRLEERGLPLRCMARRPAELKGRVPATTEVVNGDVQQPDSLAAALAGVRMAYYLIHSMGDGPDFENLDRIAARNFVEAARTAGVERIVYLGGLGHGKNLSPHLRSRHEVGQLLAASGTPVLELRASALLHNSNWIGMSLAIGKFSER